jgi:hypothetical protein
MKTTVYFLLFIASCLFTMKSFSQGYEMKEGETIIVDEYGHVLSTNMPSTNNTNVNPNSKVNSGITYIYKESDPNSNYNEDGTYKIPGYTPTGNKQEDEMNYQKAKKAFMENNPEEYKKWVEKNSPKVPIMEVKYEEYILMPDAKKQYILAHPEKYYLPFPVEEAPDCNK